MKPKRHSIELGGRTLTLETGVMAKQSAGSVTVTYGETVVLVAVNAALEPREGIDFFPLSVEYRERAYAGGKIPGGFFKREGRPTEKEILASRLTDRPIRPLFPDGFSCETQVFINLLSTDQENPADILGSIGTSVALMLSDIPWNGPIGTVRMGYVGGRAILNPTYSQLESSSLDLILTGNEDSIVMMEGEAKEISEDDFLTAVQYGHEAIKSIIKFQKEFLEGFQVAKREIEETEIDPHLLAEVKSRSDGKLQEALSLKDKMERRNAVMRLAEDIIQDVEETFPEHESTVKGIIDEKIKKYIRAKVIQDGVRMDGRGLTEIRPITIELGVLPRTHGSALFTRGETQSLATVTLGSKSDEQFIDDIDGEFKKKYMLHYNFPPFSVGEIRRYLGVSRREVGHGNLAERALKSVIPPFEEFPYTLRVVSDILESNGSSSMASVCAGSLALMDAGVPTRAAVAGVSIGLVKEGNTEVLLSDIVGEEDHHGDMDFKVAGTAAGMTSVQVDLKISGISQQLIKEAVNLAKEGRLHILDIMNRHISKPRSSLSRYAPKIVRFRIDQEKIGDLIGPGGRNIRSIIRETECAVDVDDDGVVVISSPSVEACERARKMVKAMTTDPEVGMIYDGTVRRITNFGAFVELTPGKEGLLHIRDIAHEHTDRVEDVLKVGDVVKVKVKNVDEYGRFDLSRKALLDPPRNRRYDDRHRSRSRRPGHQHSRQRFDKTRGGRS